MNGYSPHHSKHSKTRFRQRVARTKRDDLFLNRAYCEGLPKERVKDARLRRYMASQELRHDNDRIMLLYQNFIYVFNMFTGEAITVYKAPRFTSRQSAAISEYVY